MMFIATLIKAILDWTNHSNTERHNICLDWRHNFVTLYLTETCNGFSHPEVLPLFVKAAPRAAAAEAEQNDAGGD